MEELFQQLLGNGKAKNRTEFALSWKKRGNQVIGVLGPLVPEEILIANDLLPWRVGWCHHKQLGGASRFRSLNSCLFCNYVLESFLDGEFDFLDGVISSTWDDDMKRLWDVWAYNRSTHLSQIIHFPFHDSEAAREFLAEEIRRNLELFAEWKGTKASEDSLREAISITNETRRLLRQAYDTRLKDHPGLSGTEAFHLVSASMTMPKQEFNEQMKSLLGYLVEVRKAPLSSLSPRLLVSSDLLDNPAYLQLVENLGAVVAMDDLDIGSRYFWGEIDSSARDPFRALANYYLTWHNFPRSHSWESQADMIVDWVRQFNIQGVVDLPELYSWPRLFRIPYLRRRLGEADIPYLSVKRLYDFSDSSQVRTKIEAFIEIIKGSGT